MTAPPVPTETAPLPSGGALPLLGFGTWQRTGATAQAAVETAERIRAGADLGGWSLTDDDRAAIGGLSRR